MNVKQGVRTAKKPKREPEFRGELLSRPRLFRREKGGGESEIKLQSRQAVALLAYLHVHGESVSRERIVDLLWHESDSERARASLRVLLARIKSFLPGALTIDSKSVHLTPGVVSWDTTSFETLSGRSSASALAEAALLYKGAFMQDFDLGVSSDFEGWLEGEREAWRERYNVLMRRLVDHFLSQGRGSKALGYLERWRRIEPDSEAAHRQQMYLRWKAGQVEPALAQYHKLVEVLQDELGIGPEQSTQDLYRAIVESVEPKDLSENERPILQITGEPNPAHAPQDRSPNTVQEAVDVYTLYQMSADLTSFVGRERELAELLSLAQTHRLVTVHGVGGCGKTRLALEASRQLRRDFGNTFFVACEQFDTQTLAEHLGTLTARLRGSDERALIILDSFDFVPLGHAPISQLIRDVPRATVIVTSRKVLNLLGERRIGVPTLPYPQSDDLGDPQQGDLQQGDPYQLSRYPAVQLFWERAFFEGVEAALERGADGETFRDVARIARAMSGLPLGLEIAASQSQLVPLSELRANAEAAPHLLRAEHTTPLRHKSLARVAWDSWTQSSQQQQQQISQLSHCAEPFNSFHAVQKGQVSQENLRQLAASGLLFEHREGCYSFPLPFHRFVCEGAEATNPTNTNAG